MRSVPLTLLLALPGPLLLSTCGSDPPPTIAPERVLGDRQVDVKVGGSPLLTFHVQTIETREGHRVGVYAHNTGSRTINSATYVLRLRDQAGGRGIVFEYVGMLGALATGAKSPTVKLDTGVILPASSPGADHTELVQIIRLDATSFVATNPFAGLYHGTVTAPGGGNRSMSGTVAFDGQTFLAIDGGLDVGGGATLLRGTVDHAGRFTGSALRDDGLAVAVVASAAAAPALQTTPEGKLSGTLTVTGAERPAFDVAVTLDRRSQ